jgi:glycine cleavage system regulatory protein
MSDFTSEQDHVWFEEQMATALAGGLGAEERARFEAHAAACPRCAAKLEALRVSDAELSAMFASAQPPAGLEDRVIQSIRLSPRRRYRVAPAVVRAAGGIAAVIAVAATGYGVSNAINEGGLPGFTNGVKVASNLRQIGQAVLVYSNENGRLGEAPAASQALATPQEMAEGLQRNGRTYSPGYRFYRENVPGNRATDAEGRESKPNDSIGHGLAAEKDRKPGHGADSDADVYFGDGRFNGAALHGGIVAGDRSQVGMEESLQRKLSDESGRQAGQSQQEQEAIRSDNSLLYRVPAAAEAKSQAWFKPQEIAAANAVGKAIGQGAPAQQPSAPVPGASLPGAADAHGAALLPVDNEPAAGPTAATSQPAIGRKIIHSANMEFEVDRFDSAFAQVVNLTREAGGYLGSTDSDKLPNGKVKGTIVLRVPPQRLDTLILQLRGIGDLRSQKLNAEDITKQYTDLDSQLRAARAMEERLLDLIKNGKGQIKELLAAEKELGEWRTKIEKIVGEQRYYDNLVGMATLNLTLYEKDIRTPATAYEAETIDAGVETEDVEKSRAEALKAIEAAKGRIVQSDLKRYDAGQFAATIVAEVSPDAAGPLLDRLKQLGKMARLDVQRKQTTDASTSPAPAPAPAPPPGPGASVRVEKRDTRINLSLYNLANVAPRQTVAMSLAAEDIEAVYRNIIERVTKAGGRVVTSNLNRNKPEQTSGLVSFEVRSADADAVAADVRAMGEVMTTAVSENPDTNNVTTAKRLYNVQLYAAAGVRPRETTTLSIASANVSDARQALLDAASAAGARVLGSQLNDSDRQNVTARMDLEIRRDALPALDKALAAAGDTISRSVERAASSDNTIDTKVRYQISLTSAEHLAPRETTTLAVELADVETAMGDIQSAAQDAGGRTIDSNLSKQRDGRTVGKIVVDVPLAKSQEIVSKARGEGAVRVVESSKNAQVPAGKLARARVDITFGTADTLVEPGRGLWATIRSGLATSVTGLLWSVQVIVVGLCFVLPWALVIAVVWKMWRGRRRTSPAPAPAA